MLHPGETWHGFDGIEDGYCMLDPIKVTVVAPGIETDGSFSERGIPASIIAAYLSRYGFEYEKTQDFTVLFLFSIGMTKGKWGTLLTTLINFKEDYDANRPLSLVLPAIAAGYPERYRGMGLRDVERRDVRPLPAVGPDARHAGGVLEPPDSRMTPAAAYRRLVRNDVERVGLDAFANRVAATGIVPYPPGIPMLMPGESAGPADGPFVGYLRALRDWDRRFPGFGHETHGVEMEDGEYYAYLLKK